jgi:hypothetical protein
MPSDVRIRIQRQLSDTKFRAQSYLRLQIYDYITGAGANTSAGEFTDPDLGAMKLYTR